MSIGVEKTLLKGKKANSGVENEQSGPPTHKFAAVHSNIQAKWRQEFKAAVVGSRFEVGCSDSLTWLSLLCHCSRSLVIPGSERLSRRHKPETKRKLGGTGASSCTST